MLDNDLSIIIPKGNKIFDQFGNISELTEDTPIKLGTDKNSDKQATTKSGVMEEFLRRNPKIKTQL